MHAQHPHCSRITLLLTAAIGLTGLGALRGGEPIVEASFGDVRVTSPRTVLDVIQPMDRVDCDDDGALDLALPLSRAPHPAVVDFSSALPELPVEVRLRVVAADVVARALDASGREVAVATLPPGELGNLTLVAGGGIALVELHGSGICLSSVCWSARPADVEFVRGEVDGNGLIDLTDAIRVLAFLFLGLDIPCVDAADTDDSANVDLNDAMRLLLWIFDDGPPPAAPLRECGTDPTQDGLGCLASPVCGGGNGEAPTPICVDEPVVETEGSALRLRSGVLVHEEGIDFESLLEASVDDSVHFLVRLESLDPEVIEELSSAKIEVHDFLGADAFVAFATVDDLQILFDIPGLVHAGPIPPGLKLTPSLQRMDPENDLPWALTDDGRIAAYVHFHRDVVLETGSTLLAGAGVEVLGISVALRSVRALIEPDQLVEIASADPVLFVEPVDPVPGAQNDRMRRDLNVMPVWQPPYGLTGAGVTAVIYDLGNVDSNHPDFGGRVISTENPTHGSDDHATHVAGIFAGSGLNSTANGGTPGQFAGIAPRALIRSFDHDSGGLYDHADDLVENARRHAVDLVNMSLGNNVITRNLDCDLLGDYTPASRAVDAVVLGEPAATGSGSAPALPFTKSVGNDAGDRCMFVGTISSPGTAKNCIAVGGTVSGGTGPANFSGRGPTDDGRIRPDVVAPGVSVSTVPGDGYEEKFGTSMASPAVAGVVALLLEEWRHLRHIDNFESEPFPPHCIKAVLIHTATDDPIFPGPDYRRGFGGVDAKAAADILRAHDRALDAGRNPVVYSGSASPGGEPLFAEFESDGTRPQKFTLVWDDPLPSPMAAAALVNDLDLRVEAPDGTIHLPLRPDPERPRERATEGVDRVNNVEMVVADAMEGVWHIYVDGSRITTGDSQEFTLVREPSDVIEACEEELRMVVDFIPQSTSEGDRDFAAHGPSVKADARLEVRRDNELWMVVGMEANEDTGDFTSAVGEAEHVVFYSPDYETIRLRSDGFTQFEDTLSGHGRHLADMGLTDLVRSFDFVGDTDGPEAGLRTGVRIETNPIRIDCDPAPEPLKKRVVQPAPIFFIPAHLPTGDRDFHGNGPDVTLEVTLTVRGGHTLNAHVRMVATEVDGDTVALEGRDFEIWSEPDELPIRSIVSSHYEIAQYRDRDHLEDRISLTGGPVREFIAVGDSDGEDAGVRTSVTVDFNPIVIMLE